MAWQNLNFSSDELELITADELQDIREITLNLSSSEIGKMFAQQINVKRTKTERIEKKGQKVRLGQFGTGVRICIFQKTF